MYHPAAALRTPAIERESYEDIGRAPRALLDARARRAAALPAADAAAETITEPAAADAFAEPDDLTIFQQA